MSAPDLPTYPLTTEGIKKALSSLDVDSYELSCRLRDAEVKGIQGNECGCPIAVYIQRMLPGASSVFVEAEYIRIEGSQRDSFDFDVPVTLSIPLPDGAQDFVQDFDQGIYPELIQEANVDASL